MRFLLPVSHSVAVSLLLLSTLWVVVFSLESKNDFSPSLLSDAGASIPLVSNAFSRWQLRSEHGRYNITGSVPGDVLTDLERAGLIDNPYFNRNFLTQRHVWLGEQCEDDQTTCQQVRTWHYSTEIQHLLDPNTTSSNETTMLLVLEGVKMGASVAINDVALQTLVTDQFLRYIIPIPADALRHTSRPIVLTVSFDPAIQTNGRFMACSGGWDWAPYFRTIDDRGSRVGTLGLTGPVYLQPVHAVLVTDVVPHISYQGPFPLEPLWEGPRGDFSVSVRVHIKTFATLATPSIFVVVSTDFDDATVRLPVTDTGRITFNFTARHDNIQLWWPNGLGSQPLYSIHVALVDRNSNVLSQLRKKIGFRHVAVVTSNETAAPIGSARSQGSGWTGMLFQVNGAALYSRGANVVPMDQLEGRLVPQSPSYQDPHVSLVDAAAEANMNMLRIWGGGGMYPDAFYQACNERGILLYHDLMFVGEQNHSAFETETVKQELVHIIRKLAAHPSIVLWSGCNECDYNGQSMDVYESFVLPTVAGEDPTRAVWPTSPSLAGWDKGVHTMDGLPNGDTLSIRNDPSVVLEEHGPYHRGFSLTNPSVNGVPDNYSNQTLIPPPIHKDRAGPRYANTFVSEVGASVFSSFESMSTSLSPEAWSLHGGQSPDVCQNVIGNENACNGTNPLAERNYPCDNKIRSVFGGNTNFSAVGRHPFQRQLYQCVMAQTLFIKGLIESLRSTNSYGTLLWQFNENWPTGGWGLLEYSHFDKDTRNWVGGRWKPLLYLLKHHLYQDVIVACGHDKELHECYVRNDGWRHVSVQLHMEAWDLTRAEPVETAALHFDLPAGRASSTLHFSLPEGLISPSGNGTEVVLLELLDGDEGNVLIEPSAYLWKVPASMNGLAKEAVQVIVDVQLRGSAWEVSIWSDRLALYVVLSSGVIEGHFDDNAFVLRPFDVKTIAFVPLLDPTLVPIDTFCQGLRVEHLATYLYAGEVENDDTLRPSTTIHCKPALIS